MAVAWLIASRHRPHLGWYPGADPAVASRVQTRMHRRAARLGMPWPRALGTSPWALARLLSAATGTPYRIHRWNRETFGLVRRAVQAGREVALYTGGGTVKGAKWDHLPRHVVAVLPAPSSQMEVAEPSSGKTYPMSWQQLWEASVAGRAHPAFGNWGRVILAVVPNLEASETLKEEK